MSEIKISPAPLKKYRGNNKSLELALWNSTLEPRPQSSGGAGGWAHALLVDSLCWRRPHQRTFQLQIENQNVLGGYKHNCSFCIVETEKAVAPHSSTLAWKIPWMEEPGGLLSMGSLRIGHDWETSLSLLTFHFHALEKEMATHSSALAWRIPGTGEPGGLPSMRSHRVGHD